MSLSTILMKPNEAPEAVYADMSQKIFFDS